jgi:transcriptional regulator with XRE-family HTH domain
MDDQRIGRTLRALRHRLSWRQLDVGTKAGVSQDVISEIELGRLDQVTLRVFRAVAAALGAEVLVTLRWRGADLDRLMDEGHSSLVGAIADLLTGAGWLVQPEVSFAVYGERGSIDLLAWHPATRTLLVVEVKTELASVEETIRTLDVKVRLAPGVAEDRFGWDPQVRAHLLVLPERSTQRRQVARHSAVLDLSFPVRGQTMRAWIGAPDRSVGGLMFLSAAGGGRAREAAVSRKPVRQSRAEAAEREFELSETARVA